MKVKTTRGNWTTKEAKEQINYEELVVVWCGIQCHAGQKKDSHVKVLCDQKTSLTSTKSGELRENITGG